MNPHIEALVFEARTISGQNLHLRFHDITQVNTQDDLFYVDGRDLIEPIACRYSTLKLMEPEAVHEARLKALG